DATVTSSTRVNVQKWNFNGSTWAQTTGFVPTMQDATNVGARGLAAIVVGTTVRIVVSSNETATRLLTFVDTAPTSTAAATPAVTSLVTAGTNTAYRGVAFTPVP